MPRFVSSTLRAFHSTRVAPLFPLVVFSALVKAVPWSDLEPTETILGTGSFATVRIYKWLSRRMLVAVKELKREIAEMLSRDEVAALKAEASLQVSCGFGACAWSQGLHNALPNY
jgi:hypothetical protein